MLPLTVSTMTTGQQHSPNDIEVMSSTSPSIRTSTPTGIQNLGYINEQCSDLECQIPTTVEMVTTGSGSTNHPASRISANIPQTVPPRRIDGNTSFDSNSITGLGMPHRSAIVVTRARKRYGSLNVLKNINMNVREGTIYGLLGSSGCGKTTLLSCLVGLRTLDSGKILVCGKTPGTPGSGIPGKLLGFMPQDIALNGEFTIREVCHFFGRLYGMEKYRIDERVDQLLDLLDMAKFKTRIKSLSGGQKRRASFIVALLHEPEILILDEPTVGVDPVLRSNIWNHLRGLVDKCGTTVIITTHYIEEMRQADTVSIMRSGVIMTEESPSQLLATHNASMLEDVVLQYCLRNVDGDESIARRSSIFSNQFAQQSTLCNACGSDGSSWMNHYKQRMTSAFSSPMEYFDKDIAETKLTHRITALTLKNIVVTLRNIGMLLFIFMMPAIVVTTYAYAIGSDPEGLQVGVLLQSGAKCNRTDQPKYTCSPVGLDCGFANEMEHMGSLIDIKFYTEEEILMNDIKKLKTWGYLRFGPTFSDDFYGRTLGSSPNNETIQGSQIHVKLDSTTVTTAQLIKKQVFDTYRKFATKFLESCDVDVAGRDLPITIDDPIFGSQDISYRDFLAVGVATGFQAFMSALTCGLAFIIEKNDGMIERTKVAGVTSLEIMLSHLIPQIGIILAQTTFSYIIMFVAYDVVHEGSLLLAFCITVWESIAGVSLGFMASTIFDNERNAVFFAFGCMIPQFVIGGMLWPLESLPKTMQIAGQFLTGAHSVEAIRCIVFRNFGLQDLQVLFGILVPFLHIIIFTISSYLILKIRN